MSSLPSDRHHWAQEVADVLAKMPKCSAAALRLSYFEQLPEHEIAARMDASLAEVRTALANGLNFSVEPHRARRQPELLERVCCTDR